MADSPLQKGPAGLLGYFDLKTLGQAPEFFGGMVTPTADIRAFYGADNLQVISVAAAGSATGASQLSTVPNGLCYRVLAIGGILQIGVGAVFSTDVDMCAVLQPPQLNQVVPVSSQIFSYRGVTTTVSEECVAGIWFNEPPILPAGNAFGMRFSYATTAALLTQNLRALIQPFPL